MRPLSDGAPQPSGSQLSDSHESRQPTRAIIQQTRQGVSLGQARAQMLSLV